MTDYWKNKRVLVTGGTGFIGSHLVEALVRLRARVSVPTSTGNLVNIAPWKHDITIRRADLSDQAVTRTICKHQDVVMHLAARVAGIQYNRLNPATMFRDNIILNTSVMAGVAAAGVERVLIMSSACVYPHSCPQPIRESSGFLNVPEPTNSGYGWSKRVLEIGAAVYAKQYGTQIAIARPFNTYGPRDHFDPSVAHVIPDLICRIHHGENPLVVWGSGHQTRSFIFVRDLVRGLLLLTEHYPQSDPVNIGSSEEISIGSLARLTVKLSGRTTKITFDTQKPDGQHRRQPDISKAQKLFGFTPKTTLADGLAQTIRWYESQR